jgi:F-type H+-transporting ATPase subunit delta
MRPDAVARRYARALFRLAEEQGTVDSTGAALAVTAELVADPQVARVLMGPVARERKRELLRDIATNTGAPLPLSNFLQLLGERDRLRHLNAIRVVFDELVDRRCGRTRATVRSAVVLQPDALAELTRVFGALTGKQVIAEVRVEPELLAGAIVEVEGRVYDGSLRTQLGKLRHQMASDG